MVRRILQRRKKRRRRRDDEEPLKSRQGRSSEDRLGVMALQRQVGNQAVQEMLGQRQAAEQTDQDSQTAQDLVEVGQIKIEKPEIKEYEVTGESLDQVTNQILPAEQWYEYEYEYDPKVENEAVTQVDVAVRITLHLPLWVGPGWERASDLEKMAWLEMLKSFGNAEDEQEAETLLPQQWLGVNWEQAPEALKAEWLKMMLEFQTEERTPLDIAHRRAVVLQQRLINQPEENIKEIFDKFWEDLEQEETAYNEEREPGQIQQITLEPDTMVQ